MIKNALIILSIFLFLILSLTLKFSFAQTLAQVQTKTKAKTKRSSVMLEEVIIENGMLRTTYDENGDGLPDTADLRRLDGMLGYKKFPLFYLRSKTETGWGVTIRDMEEDGLNGNESLYNIAIIFKKEF